jgi:hypothetical protein
VEGVEEVKDRTWEPCERLSIDVPLFVEAFEEKKRRNDDNIVMSKPSWLLHTFYSFDNFDMAQGGTRFSQPQPCPSLLPGLDGTTDMSRTVTHPTWVVVSSYLFDIQ